MIEITQHSQNESSEKRTDLERLSEFYRLVGVICN